MGALSGKGTHVNKVIRKGLSAYKGEMGEYRRSKAKCRFPEMGTCNRCLDGKQSIVDDFLGVLQ